MVSFKENATTLETNVALYRYFMQSFDNGRAFELKRELMWDRILDIGSDFAHHFKAPRFSVEADAIRCNGCFKLFFSFFSDRTKPLKLPHGLWNCSVDHYASFHHHVACNLKTECEDAQDETGDCPYSSPRCDGLIASCDQCYKLVDSLEDFISNKTDVNQRANEYCESIESRPRFPMCVDGWYGEFRKKTKSHPDRFRDLWVGLYSKDNSLPNMYRHALVDLDNGVIHHFWRLESVNFRQTKSCCFIDPPIKFDACIASQERQLNRGTVCELTNSKMTTNSSWSRGVFVNNSTFVLAIGQLSMTECAGGHLTHAFFVCGSFHYKVCRQQTSSPCIFSSGMLLTNRTSHRASSVATFACDGDSIQISYTLVCDVLADCPDESDESFCKHPACFRQFRCHNGECLPYDKVCDDMLNCRDDSDEDYCEYNKVKPTYEQKWLPSPALVRFDGVLRFVYTPMKSNESCPDSHYRCPGEFDDCLPVYTRCNGPYDCIDHQDEEGCEEMECPGLFRCRRATVCLHSDHVCDGWPHCPMNDDELSCGIMCPINCLCQGHTFLCPQPFSTDLFPQLRYLDGTGSGLTLHDMRNNTLLIGLLLAKCSLTSLLQAQLRNVRYLDLSANQIQYVNLSSVIALESLQTLSLSSNPLSSLCADFSSDDQHSALTVLHLAHTTLTVLDTTVLSPFPLLKTLNLSSTSIHTISPVGFQFTPQLKEVHLDHSPVDTFPADLFQHLPNLRLISAQNYKFCCAEVLPQNVDPSDCLAPKNEVSSCKDLLQSWVYRGFLWLAACLSLSGNIFCFCARFFIKSSASSIGFRVFVGNLALADFLMGVYLAVIGAADEQFRGRYLHNDSTWRDNVICKIAGLLSFLSSEVSVLIIWFITLDRFVVLRFPFSSRRFGRTSAAVACLLNWLVGWALAILPLLPMTSHWEFYSQTGICIPLPVTRQNFKGRFYSIGVLIIFNFILCSCISAGQVFIYLSVQSNAMKTNSTNVSRDMTIARRLVIVAMTDFLCWFPIGLCGMLALGGTPISGEVNVALAVFVLPINSAINPFMYTFNTLAEKRRKFNEDQLLQWLKAHPDVIAD